MGLCDNSGLEPQHVDVVAVLMKLADMSDLGSLAERRAGSSPADGRERVERREGRNGRVMGRKEVHGEFPHDVRRFSESSQSVGEVRGGVWMAGGEGPSVEYSVRGVEV